MDSIREDREKCAEINFEKAVHTFHLKKKMNFVMSLSAMILLFINILCFTTHGKSIDVPQSKHQQAPLRDMVMPDLAETDAVSRFQLDDGDREEGPNNSQQEIGSFH